MKLFFFVSFSMDCMNVDERSEEIRSLLPLDGALYRASMNHIGFVIKCRHQNEQGSLHSGVSAQRMRRFA